MTEENNESNVTDERPTITDTDIIIEDETIGVTETPVYTFTITEKADPDYSMSHSILTWIHDNLAGLQDDYLKPIFGKVNYGFNDDIIKTFGKKPVCDVYIDSIEYEGDFDSHIPIKVHSIVIFYMKGANNPTYLKATELHDLLMQEFITNNSFKRLDDTVQDTYIMNSEIRNQNIRGGYGVMGVFELTHDLYY